jgi:long-chain acyl-CoA synthetase
MKSRTSWRWNAVLGQYEAGGPPLLEGTGEISAIGTFSNKTILILGATGFVGKVVLAMILDRFPELKHLILQVRRKKNMSGEQRFYSEILTSPPLRATALAIGEETLRRTITVIEGDLDQPLCGISPEVLQDLQGTVDVVVNIAGVVDFDPPINESVEPNVYGTQHLIELVKLLHASLVHVSTAYVAGKKNGHISENSAIDGYFPLRGEPGETRKFSVAEELHWYRQFVEETRATKATNPRPVRERLRDGGMQRAEYWGWTNTYTYTKSMGEQLIAQSNGLRYAIVRPAIVESSMRFPFPGWNEGFTTSAPLVLMGGEGVKGWPVRKDGPLEIIPVDLVAAGILIVTAAVLAARNEPVYHLASADENPIMLPRLVAFLGMNSRYKHKHKKSGNKLANAWKAYVETQVITIESLKARRARLHRGLDVIHAALTLGKTVLGDKKVGRYIKSLRDTRRQIRQQEVTLDKFLPFMFHNSFIFETRNIRRTAGMLTSEDLKRIKWDPETIDWADYWVNIHTKGIEKWIRPVFTGPKKTAS